MAPLVHNRRITIHSLLLLIHGTFIVPKVVKERYNFINWLWLYWRNHSFANPNWNRNNRKIANEMLSRCLSATGNRLQAVRSTSVVLQQRRWINRAILIKGESLLCCAWPGYISTIATFLLATWPITPSCIQAYHMIWTRNNWKKRLPHTDPSKLFVSFNTQRSTRLVVP